MKPRALPFAKKVRERLREKGLGLREFCRAVDLDPSFFSKVLAGKRSPPSDEAQLRRIAEVLRFDAPGLIVAAGRIPSEWERLWHDGALFQQVHQLAAGRMKPAAGLAQENAWTAAASEVRVRVKKDFGDELL